MDFNNYLNQLNQIDNQETVRELEFFYSLNSDVLCFFKAIDNQFQTLNTEIKFDSQNVKVIINQASVILPTLSRLKFEINILDIDSISDENKAKINKNIAYIENTMTLNEVEYMAKQFVELLQIIEEDTIKKEKLKRAEERNKKRLILTNCKKGIFAENRAFIFHNEKVGFIDENENIVIPLKYDTATNFQDGLARVSLNGKYGYIDKNGTEIIPLIYDNFFCCDFETGFIRMLRDGKAVLVDKNGRELFNQYDNCFNFSEGLAAVKLKDKWGFINESGKLIVPTQYDEVNEFHEGLAIVRLNNDWRCIDKEGNKIFTLQYDNIAFYRAFSKNGLMPVQLNGKWGFIDKRGYIVIQIKYSNVDNFYDDLAAVQLDSKYWGLINQNDVLLAKYKCSELRSMQEGFAAIRDGKDYNGKWGFVGYGKSSIPNKYDFVYSFSEKLACVKSNGRYGYINEYGEEIIPLKYEYAQPFNRNGLAGVTFNNKHYYINKNGVECSTPFAL